METYPVARTVHGSLTNGSHVQQELFSSRARTCGKECASQKQGHADENGMSRSSLFLVTKNNNTIASDHMECPQPKLPWPN